MSEQELNQGDQNMSNDNEPGVKLMDALYGGVIGLGIGLIIVSLVVKAEINQYKRELVQAGVYEYNADGKFVKKETKVTESK